MKRQLNEATVNSRPHVTNSEEIKYILANKLKKHGTLFPRGRLG